MFGSILCGTSSKYRTTKYLPSYSRNWWRCVGSHYIHYYIRYFSSRKAWKNGGLFGAVFGLSSIFGPLLGAYITDYISWHWIFYINLPLGIISLILIALYYKESLQHQKQKIDWVGLLPLLDAVVCLMFALELGGNKYAWDSINIISLFSGFAVLFILFIIAERKASDPIISFLMFKDRLFAGSTIVGLLYGVAFIVGAVFIPIFIQGVTGGSATNSGLILLPMMLGVVVSAQVGAISAAKFGYRNVMLIFAFIFVVGMYLLSTVSAETTRATVTWYMIIVGLGTGASFSVLNMSAIHNISPEHRGSAYSTVSFVRQLGMTVGITIYGIIQRNVFTDRFERFF